MLLLADGRFPAGGYAHSGGLEPTVQVGRLSNAAELEQFLVGRVETAGFVAAVFAAAACSYATREDSAALSELKSEFNTRIPSSELHSVSRMLGRQLLRATSTIYPHSYFSAFGLAPHQPLVMGVNGARSAFDRADRGPDADGSRSAAVLGENRAVGSVIAIDPAWTDVMPTASAFHANAVLTALPGPGMLISAVAQDSLQLRKLLDRGLDALGAPWRPEAAGSSRDVANKSQFRSAG